MLFSKLVFRTGAPSSCVIFQHPCLSLRHLQIQCLQQNVDEVNNRFSVLLNQLQVSITTLEMELQQVRISIEKQQGEYNLLLDIKMRLEMEIAEYRRLLDGEQITYEVEEKK